MKFLVIQENGRHDKNRNFRECFCLQRALIANGQECTVWGLNHDNWNQLKHPYFNLYDVIINLENYDETGWVPSLAHTPKPYKILWSIDAHVKGIQQYLQTFKEGKYNLILQATKNYVDENSVWFPNCYDNTLIGPRNVEKVAAVGFCGNLLNRGPWIEVLQQNFHPVKVDLFVIGEDMVNAINSYRIHFNLNIANDINYRSFETIGCGVPLITNYNPQYDELGFKDGVNCLMYHSGNELVDKLRPYLHVEHGNLTEIGKKGLDLATKHTYTKRIEHLIRYLKTRI